MVNPTETPVQQPTKAHRPILGRIVLVIIAVLALAFVAIQLIPVNRTNPAATTQIKWNYPQTETLARRACMDCHSNETVWPWYSYVAPSSWLIYYDVQRGRSEMNLSSLNSSTGGAQREAAPSADLAYQLGQILAGGGGDRGPGSGQGGQQLNRQFTPPAGGQTTPGGQAFGRGAGGGLANRISEAIQSGQMPPAKYTLMHPTAILTSEEKQQLIQGLQATLGSSTP
jgi:hypothetical protein